MTLTPLHIIKSYSRFQRSLPVIKKPIKVTRNGTWSTETSSFKKSFKTDHDVTN